MNLWTFLTVVIIAWAIVEIVTTQKKQKGSNRAEADFKAFEERLEKIEKRIQNLEAIATDDDLTGKEGAAYKEETSERKADFTGRLHNKLK